MSEPVLTNGGVDRRQRLCRCKTCGRVERCTPSFDFYTEPGNDNGPLECERCMRADLAGKGYRWMDTTKRSLA